MKACIIALLLLCAGLSASSKTLYVWPGSPSPLSPYGSWNTAARTLQDAIAPAVDGDLVMVTNDIYQVGGLSNYPSGSLLSNRLAVTKAIEVRGVTSPALPVIVGQGPVGNAAVRGVYLGTNASLVNFIITNGATRATGDNITSRSGGGVWCSAGSIVSNCTIVGNYSYAFGGGVYGGTLYNCTILNNSSDQGGGISHSTAFDSLLKGNASTNYGGASCSSAVTRCSIYNNSSRFGGGVYFGSAFSCSIATNDSWWGSGGGALYADVADSTLYMNTANGNGGGAASSTLRNCLIHNNGVNQEGGGAYLSICRNCTIADNGASKGGGVSGGTQENCIVYFNLASSGTNYWQADMRFCDSEPDFGVQGCISTNPAFIDQAKKNYRLRYQSSCIDHGTNAVASCTNDLDGFARPLDGNYDSTSKIDIGAYEYNPMVYDMDKDGMPDGAEVIADTDPLSNGSFLAVSAFSVSNNAALVNWCGGAAATQYLERATDISSTGQLWTSIFTNLPPTTVSTNYEDVGASGTSMFYRVRVVR